jgi:hypothetical protein
VSEFLSLRKRGSSVSIRVIGSLQLRPPFLERFTSIAFRPKPRGWPVGETRSGSNARLM